MGKGHNWKIITATVVVIVFIVSLVGGILAYNALKYKNRFYPGTTINDTDVTGMTPEEVAELFRSAVAEYRLTVDFLDEKIQIYGSEIGLGFNESSDFQAIKDEQNSYGYSNVQPEQLIFNVDNIFVYDESKIEEILEACDSLSIEDMEEGEDAALVYDISARAYHWVDGDKGNKIALEDAVTAVKDAIATRQTSVDLWEVGAYERPKLIAGNALADELLEEAQSYLEMEVIYKFTAEGGEPEEKINYRQIVDWLYIDDYEIAFDTDKIQRLVESYAEAHNTEAMYKDFVTASGYTIPIAVPVSGETVDTDAMYTDILTCLDEKASGERTALYTSDVTASSINFGGDYVEVDIINQKLYLFKHGKLVLVSDVVTGSVAAGHSTPTGVYTLKYKERNTVLRGPDYASPVSFWMPFNGGVGFHDATWRYVFGGTIYKYSGSHGCVNMPYANAKILYENIYVGYNVIVYNDVPEGMYYDPSTALAGKDRVTTVPMGSALAQEVMSEETETESETETETETETEETETEESEETEDTEETEETEDTEEGDTSEETDESQDETSETEETLETERENADQGEDHKSDPARRSEDGVNVHTTKMTFGQEENDSED